MSPDNLNTDRQADVTRWLIPATGWSQDHQLNSPVCFCRQTDRQTYHVLMSPAGHASLSRVVLSNHCHFNIVHPQCMRMRTWTNASCQCTQLRLPALHLQLLDKPHFRCIDSYFFIYVYQCYLWYVRCGKCTALCRAIKISFIFWHRLTCIVNTLFVHAHHNKS